MGRLYYELRTLRYFFYGHLGPTEADDGYHELIIDVFAQIRRGDLREPARLVGYARTIASRKIAESLRARVRAREKGVSIEAAYCLSTCGDDPESEAIRRENTKLAMRILAAAPARDREVLVRFYLDEQTPEEIQAAMGLTKDQFRLIKSRAKSRFTKLCEARLKRPPVGPFGFPQLNTQNEVGV